jgi:hypothetical protein
VTTTTRREMLMTQLVPKDTDWTDGSNSPTYRVRIRLGFNWGMHTIMSYNPNDFTSERTDETPRLVELDGDTPAAVTIGSHIYEVSTIS